MKLKLLMLVLALQSAWILATTVLQERALALGKIILLETQRVDPRDLLRGDYLILNYKISEVPRNLFSSPLTANPRAGLTVYVALEPRGQFYEIKSASTNRLTPTGAAVVLKGKIRSWTRPGAANEQTVHLDYGLERYYVREGTGNPQGKLTAQVAVPSSGQGAIKQVLVDGKPYAEAMKKH